MNEAPDVEEHRAADEPGRSGEHRATDEPGRSGEHRATDEPGRSGGRREDDLAALARAAQAGDAAALERLLLAVRDRVYRLSLRMTARPADAEDATQEILVRVLTRLSTFRGEAAVETWVHRIAVNHLLDRAKSCVERLETTFDEFAADLVDGLSAAPSSAPDAALLEREVQLACTHALLTCLDRDHRVAYVLGEVFCVDSDDGGYICDVTPATYRKRLSRARTRVRAFLGTHCGLVSDDAACRCAGRVDVAVRLGRVDPAHLEFVDPTSRANDEMIRLHDAADLLRSLPAARVPDGITATIERLLSGSSIVTGPARAPES